MDEFGVHVRSFFDADQIQHIAHFNNYNEIIREKLQIGISSDKLISSVCINNQILRHLKNMHRISRKIIKSIEKANISTSIRNNGSNSNHESDTQISRTKNIDELLKKRQIEFERMDNFDAELTVRITIIELKLLIK